MSTERTFGKLGSHGLSEAVVNSMIADYMRLQSIKAVAALHGRTPQVMREILRRRAALQPRQFAKKIFYKGEPYSFQKVCFMGTRTKNKRLHIEIWREHHGEVPPGHVITFQDNDPHNVAIENLICVRRGEHVARRIKGLKRGPRRFRLRPEIVDYIAFRDSLLKSA